jgi:hypothetical protein
MRELLEIAGDQCGAFVGFFIAWACGVFFVTQVVLPT